MDFEHRSRKKRAQKRYEREASLIPSETSYLIEDVTELVNERFDTFLQNEPFSITAKGFHPELVSGDESLNTIKFLTNTYLPTPIVPRQFLGMDIAIEYPIKMQGENPINIALNWSDGRDIRLAVVDSRPILIAEESGHSGKIFHVEQVHPEVMSDYFDGLNMPESFWGNDMKELTRDFYHCPDFTMTRSRTELVDLRTTLCLTHSARLMHDIDDNKQLIQELTVDIDHFTDRPARTENDMYLSPQEKFRNALRFERNKDNSSWRFIGAYQGVLGVGELLDELIQVDPKLVVPNGKTLDKVLTVLSQVEKN